MGEGTWLGFTAHAIVGGDSGAATLCLASGIVCRAGSTYQLLGKPAGVEFIVVDDSSDRELGICETMRWLREVAGTPCMLRG